MNKVHSHHDNNIFHTYIHRVHSRTFDIIFVSNFNPQKSTSRERERERQVHLNPKAVC